MKDNFSAQSNLYAQFRPAYPPLRRLSLAQRTHFLLKKSATETANNKRFPQANYYI